MRGIEAGTSSRRAGVRRRTRAARWTGPTLSGGPGSLVPWATLGREGRRHVLSQWSGPSRSADRPAGVPDLSIETVMGEPALATPVQVYVGLDSAATVRERVDLALAELERTGAFDRSLLMLVSPTGTGYVNYVAARRGAVPVPRRRRDRDDAVLEAALTALARQGQGGPRAEPAAVAAHPGAAAATGRDRGPGSSCSARAWAHTPARTSSCTGAPWACEALGIDRALWIGTPYGSGWMHEVTGPDRLDVDRDSVAVVNDFAQLRAVDADRGRRPPYVLLSHDNDGVTKFGPDLLTTAPALARPAAGRRPSAVDGASPRGIPTAPALAAGDDVLPDPGRHQERAGARHLPGWGHDYRPDLARFVSEVYGLPGVAGAAGRGSPRPSGSARRSRWQVFQED